MMLIEQRGGFLHEHRPDVIPQGFMTEQETALWIVYHERRAASQAKG